MWAYRRPAALASPSQTFDFLASHWKGAKILQSCWCLTLNSSKWKGKGVRTNLIPKYSWNCQNPQLSERNFFKNDDHQPSQQKSTAPTFVEKFPRVFFFRNEVFIRVTAEGSMVCASSAEGKCQQAPRIGEEFSFLGGSSWTQERIEVFQVSSSLFRP